MIIDSVVVFFQTGGGFMYPIAFVFVIGLVIAIERWIFLTQVARSNNKVLPKIIAGLEEQNIKKVLTLVKKSKAFVSSLVGNYIVKSSNVQDRSDLESLYNEGLLEVVPRLQRRTQYLATLANVATLLGLLGTIIGLIAAFTAVAQADPAQKASLLSQSISVAMNTTAFGLMTAIPLLLTHAMIQSKAAKVFESLEIVGVKCVNCLRNKTNA